MKTNFIKGTPIKKIFIMLVFLSFHSLPVEGATYYKKYTVKKDKARDILCDSVVVQKNDYVIKIFKQYGEIARADFPEFLSIFKRINPHVYDINLIRPGQRILIPLKKLSPGTYPNQTNGFVTIPFFSISKFWDGLDKPSTDYKVQKGDSVSKIIASFFGSYHSKPFKKALRKFKELNPEIENINIIYPGQTLKMPGKNQTTPKIKSLNNSLVTIQQPLISTKTGNKSESASIQEENKATRQQNLKKLFLQKLFDLCDFLDSKLIHKGIYHFPVPDGKSIQLDLKQFPVIEFENKIRVILMIDQYSLSSNEIKAINNFWVKSNFLNISSNSTLEDLLDTLIRNISPESFGAHQTFYDKGTEIFIKTPYIIKKPIGSKKIDYHICLSFISSETYQIPKSIWHFLEKNNVVFKEIFIPSPGNSDSPIQTDHPSPKCKSVVFDFLNKKDLIQKVLKEMDYDYRENLAITFPYAGIQIQARANMIYFSNRPPLLIDYGSLFGDAIEAIRNNGFEVIQVNKTDTFPIILRKLFKNLNVNFTENPVFNGIINSNRTDKVTIKIPGFYVKNKINEEFMFSFTPLIDPLIQFLSGQ